MYTTTAAAPSTFSLSNGFYTQDLRIWVDWNSDFDLTDAGEEVYNATLAPGQIVNSSFSVPAGYSSQLMPLTA